MQYLSRACHQIKTVSILSLQNEETFSRMTTTLLCMVQNPHQGDVVAEKQLQGSQSLQEKFWASTSLVLLQETWILRRTVYQQEVRWLQSSKGERRARQIFPSENQAKLLEVCSPYCSPDKSANFVCSACLCNLCVYWMTTDFIKLGLQEKQRLYFTFLLLPLLFKSSDYGCVSGCVGSCLASLTCCVFCRRELVLK